MRQFFPVEDLARDERFVQTNMAERMKDARTALDTTTSSSAKSRGASKRLTPDRHDASDAARSLMHGIMVGEIQALEGAGRTAHDFDAGDGSGDTMPFELKLDMARQCLGRGSPRRDQGQAVRLDGHRDRRVRRERRCCSKRRAPTIRSCASPASTGPSRAWRSTCSPDEGVRRHRRTTRTSSSARTGCSPTRSPT